MRSASVLETGWHKQIKNIVNRVLQIYYIYSLQYMNTFTQNIILYFRAVDLHSFFSDPDPAVFLNADPDPAAF